MDEAVEGIYKGNTLFRKKTQKAINESNVGLSKNFFNLLMKGFLATKKENEEH